MKDWVVFFWNEAELMSYTLRGEMEGEREETIKLLSYMFNIPENEIGFKVVARRAMK